MNLIPYMNPGDSIPLSSAEIWNTFATVINSMIMGRGTDGIKFTLAKEGAVWSFNKGTTNPGTSSSVPNGSGNLNWAGVWNVTTKYKKNDVVTMDYNSDAEYAKQGSYISLVDNNLGNEPPVGDLRNDANWATFSPGHWSQLYIGNRTKTDPPFSTNHSFTQIAQQYIMAYGNNGPAVHGQDGATAEITTLQLCPDTGLLLTGQQNTLNFDAVYNFGKPLAFQIIAVPMCDSNGNQVTLYTLGVVKDANGNTVTL